MTIWTFVPLLSHLMPAVRTLRHVMSIILTAGDLLGIEQSRPGDTGRYVSASCSCRDFCAARADTETGAFLSNIEPQPGSNLKTSAESKTHSITSLYKKNNEITFSVAAVLWRMWFLSRCSAPLVLLISFYSEWRSGSMLLLLYIWQKFRVRHGNFIKSCEKI